MPSDDGRTAQMIFPVVDILVYLTRFVTLEPGDVVLTGTPEGVGALHAGDTVEVEVEGHGDATHVGDLEVEDHEVGRIAQRGPQAHGAVGLSPEDVAMPAQGPANMAGELQLVLDDKDAHGVWRHLETAVR